MTPGHHVDDVTQAARPAVDASMTLLNEVMHSPLDAGYKEAAARKATGDRSPRRGFPLILLAILLGFMTTTAAAQLRAPQPGVVAARTILVDEILHRREQVAEKTTQNAVLQAKIDTLRDGALQQGDPTTLAQVTADALVNGTVATAGPGITVTIEDGPAIDNGAALVQDVDLQLVVNALWAAGAEAMAINGQRLTSTTAIRSAGSAILVDLVGVAGPYEIVVIGGKNDLETGYARSSAAQNMSALGSEYGIKTTIASHDSLTVSAGPTRVLFYAEPIKQGEPAPTTDLSSPARATTETGMTGTTEDKE